ncbi:MAG: NERD domain-containing protein [Acidimicrobiales bacterium]
MAVRKKALEALRRRELAGARRSGRYARRKMWDRNIRFVKRAWPYLLFPALIVIAGFAPFAWQYPGRPAWFIMGVAIASAFWLVVVSVLIFSGTIGAYSGLIAETATAEELRRFGRRGWRLVNGLKLRGRADIDHIVVGPGGVLVVETKYSDDAWPLGGTGDSVMIGRLRDAKDQVRRSARDVARHEEFRRAIAGAPVVPVLVVHSAAPAGDVPRWLNDEGVTVVPDRYLREWLATLEGAEVLDPQGVERVWAELSKHADRRDRKEATDSGPPQPTLTEVLLRITLHVPAGVLLAAYAIANPLTRRHGDWTYAIVLPAAIALGVWLYGRRPLRWLATGWLLGCLGMTAVLVAVTARFLGLVGPRCAASVAFCCKSHP